MHCLWMTLVFSSYFSLQPFCISSRECVFNILTHFFFCRIFRRSIAHMLGMFVLLLLCVVFISRFLVTRSLHWFWIRTMFFFLSCSISILLIVCGLDWTSFTLCLSTMKRKTSENSMSWRKSLIDEAQSSWISRSARLFQRCVEFSVLFLLFFFHYSCCFCCYFFSSRLRFDSTFNLFGVCVAARMKSKISYTANMARFPWFISVPVNCI